MFTPEFKIYGGVVVKIVLFSIPGFLLIYILVNFFRIAPYIKKHEDNEIKKYLKQTKISYILLTVLTWYLMLQTLLKEYIFEFYL